MSTLSQVSVPQIPLYHPDGAQPFAYDAKIFQAVLLPYRSLGPAGFKLLISCLLIAWAGFGLMFIKLGAWPIFGFFGLDFALIYLAFRLNYRAGRMREEITLSRSALTVTQITPSGNQRHYSFDPFWVKLEISRKKDIGITAIHIQAKGQSVLIGSFLPLDDRETFATAFTRALAQSRGR